MSTQVRRWWLSLQGKVDGPRSQAYVLMALQSGQLSAATQVCPEGGTEWKPLSEWTEFRLSSPAAPPPQPNQPAASYTSGFTNDRLLTNARLPPMANAVCVFTIVLLPLYWIYGTVTALATLDESEAAAVDFLFGLFLYGPATLAVTIALMIGGLRLRDLRASGLRLIKIVLIIDFVLIAVSCLLLIPLVLIAAANDPSPSSPTGIAILLEVIEGIAAFAALVFEIIAFIWLYKNGSRLPLDVSR